MTKAIFLTALVVSLGGLLQLGLASTAEAQTGVPTNRVSNGVLQAEVLIVSLDRKVQRRGVDGKVRSWSQAYMVRLPLQTSNTWAAETKLFVGDEAIGEYGGWEGGIYFWVYGDEALERIQGQAVRAETQGARSELGSLEIAKPSTFKKTSQKALRAASKR
ncbi:MAG: hypothetical protein AAFZ38_06730 [Myxococcota bacterium]